MDVRIGGRTDGGIGRLDEWAGGVGLIIAGYRRIPQDTACYPQMLQDTFIVIFSRFAW